MNRPAVREQARAGGPFGYRPDIDGLRAVAVLAVILNHFNPRLLPSGYLGVDIFFVISGFVITASLTRTPHNSAREFFLGFYARRFRRLLPALFVMVLVTSILTTLFDPDPSGSLNTALASLFGASNLQLLHQSTDYFALSTEFNSFTHTWSLGVEEQFYLLFPLLLWFTGAAAQRPGGSRRFALLLTLIAIGSLIAYAVLSRTSQAFAYFSMPTRLWELAAGSLLFLALRRDGIRRGLAQLPPALLLGLLVVALFTGFKVKSTIAVVVLTVLLIASLRPSTAAFRLLTLPQAVQLGLLSYSLYLWHWPVLSLSRWTIGIHAWTAPLQALLMLALAWISYRWIESPLRHAAWTGGPRRSLGLGFTAAGLTALVPLALLVPRASAVLFRGDLSRERDEGGISEDRVVHSGRPEGSCLWWRGEGPSLEDAARRCIRGRGGHQRFFLLGDSHTGHLSHWLSHTVPARGYWVREAAAGGQSVPVIPVTDSGLLPGDRIRQRDARRQSEWIQRTLADARPGDTLILISYLQQQFRTPEQRDSPSPDRLHSRWDRWIRDLETLIDRAGARGAHVVLFAPTPDFQIGGPLVPATRQQQACTRQWFRPSPSQACLLREPRQQAVAEAAPILARLRELERRHGGFHVFDPFSPLCPAAEGHCSNYLRGRRIFRDDNHLSLAGSALLTQAFEDSLKRWGISPAPPPGEPPDAAPGRSR